MKENILFEIYKDTRALGTSGKREKIRLKFPDVNMSLLHRKILNYQIKKYGQSLC